MSSRQTFAEAPGHVVERLAVCGGTVMRRELDPEVIALPPRDHVQVRMKDFLACGGAVRQKEVEGFAAQSGRPERRGDPPGERPHRDRRNLVNLADRRGVLAGDDEGVALGDRMKIEERQSIGTLGDEARLLFTLDDPAEHTGGRFGHEASSRMAFARACAPSAASSTDANSRGVCEPPVERTKIIPVRTPDSAGFCASWPAPLTSSGASTPTLFVARLRTSRIFGSRDVTGTRASSSMVAVTPRELATLVTPSSTSRTSPS